MRLSDGRVSLSPTDIANFLACRHKTSLDVLVAQGKLDAPTWRDPLADVLAKRGDHHEAAYIDALRAGGATVVDLSHARDNKLPPDEAVALSLDAMRAGIDVIVQAPLSGDGWFGYADVLRRVSRPSTFGAWSYEVEDTKLARETKGGTILQLCAYTDLVGAIQRRVPELFHVVTPATVETYRFDDFAAFYRFVKSQLLAFVGRQYVGRPGLGAAEVEATYPNLTDHCEFCRWWPRCNAQRRRDDHLSFVAGLGRLQQVELEGRDVGTLAALAGIPVPIEFKPRRGAPETYGKLQHQAALQLTQRETGTPTFAMLPVKPDFGLTRLPAPSEGDLFLDLEGDPFARPSAGSGQVSGREYLFGLGRVASGRAFDYMSRWSFTDDEERAAFEATTDCVMAALASDPGMHVYHYAAYEPSAFKRLAGRYATREAEVDTLLRGGRFVDLFAILRHTLRAGVESYSIKMMEPFYEFARDVELTAAGDQRRIVEIALEMSDLATVTPEVRAVVEGYNKDDCRSTLELRAWLEKLRATAIEGGADIPRPPLVPGLASERIRDRDRRAADLRARLLARIHMEGGRSGPPFETVAHHALYLLAYLVDWHRREERVAWGEYHRLREKSDEDLKDEPGALVELTHVRRVFTPSGRARAAVDRYTYPVQENDVRRGDEIKLRTDVSLGKVEAIDRNARSIDIRKRVEQNDVHPTTVISLRIVNAPEQEDAICRIAERVIEAGLDDDRGDRLVNDLLLGRPPRLRSSSSASRGFGRGDQESASNFAVRIVGDLDDSLLAIQGPPGTGKTFTGALMIRALVAQGSKVGVVATGHKVIRKLLVDAGKAARCNGTDLPIAHKPGDDELPDAEGIEIDEPDGNPEALAFLDQLGGRVLGGTAWLWSRPELAKRIDVLFVDEAGQMSLANLLAIAQAAHSLVLLGDPQQLDQPQKASHPDGVDVSALEHILAGHKTMPEGRGIFLPITWRLAPEICKFTSEVFYEGKLTSRPGNERQRLSGAGRFAGAGLWVVEVPHDGCRNASDEEAEVVAALADQLLTRGSMWTDADSRTVQMTAGDILVVAPYNAHVARLRERLDPKGIAVGTVDKFQGQEAPVVIYSMATSRPEDAPRGMEFLYSLNRLNVATSRAKCACILVASPRLFEPECRTPRQMQLAAALCRYRELAQLIRLSS